MLRKLYRKLYCIFVISIMLIISVIITVTIRHDIATERDSELLYVQKMSMLIIYQLENGLDSFEDTIESYTRQGEPFCILRDAMGRTIYRNDVPFPTAGEDLLQALGKQMCFFTDTMPKGQESMRVTEQSGPMQITGQNKDLYWGISASVVSKNGAVYDLSLFYRAATVREVVGQRVPGYILVWAFSFACVMLLSRLILRQAFGPTEQMLTRQKEFIASASHELKSPLSVLLAHIEKIRKCDAQIPDLKRSADVMCNECMRMSRLVNDLLLLASFDANLKQLVKKEINIDTLLISLYEKYETLCAEKAIPLRMDLSETRYPTVVSDPELILQILSIFMDNALSHSDSNFPIEIQASFTTKYITFCIVDHGKGISEKDRPLIFNRFYCADHSHTEKSHFGLGLSIAVELAAILCGKVGFYDTSGGGATFYLTIPIKMN